MEDITKQWIWSWSTRSKEMICIECEIEKECTTICFNCGNPMCRLCRISIHREWLESAGYKWAGSPASDVGNEYQMSCFKCYTLYNIAIIEPRKSLRRMNINRTFVLINTIT